MSKEAVLGREDSHDKAGSQDNLKKGIYSVIYQRRDIRGQFLDRQVGEEILARILDAAHHAPSVGFMQPWNFIIIRSMEVRKRIHDAFTRANDESADMFPEAKRTVYKGFKLEGILDAPLNICVTCDRERFGPVVIGRTTNKDMDMFSVVCAVQNLWLTARAENLGVGWVSIMHKNDLASILELPNHVEPVAYLCVGYVSHFPDRPELETAGWLPRLKLKDLVYADKWEGDCSSAWPALHEKLGE